MPGAVYAKDFKIGVIFDETGPFAGGGSKASLLGTELAIDMINERGGVEGYTIVPTYVDAQSKIDIALNEAERLINDGTMQGYGVNSYPPGHRMAGQNERSIAVVMHYVDGKTNVVWPKQLRTAEPMLPLPAGHAYAP
jgi:hypothetical protein